MKKKRKGQWQADMFIGFNEGWAVAIDPVGVLIQGVGMARKTDWNTIGGASFWKKASIARWFGKLLLPAFMVWFVYTAWPTHWTWIVGFVAVATLLNVLGILWRAKHPVIDAEQSETDPGPDPSTLSPGLSEPVMTEKPKAPEYPVQMETLVQLACQDEKYMTALIESREDPTDNDALRYMRYFEEGLNITEAQAPTFQESVYQEGVLGKL